MRSALVIAGLCAGALPALAQSARPATPASAPAAAAAPRAPTLDTTILPPQEIGTIRFGERRTGMLESGDFTMGDGTWADVWYFEATAGQRVTIEVSSRQIDPYEQLLDPWGNKVGDDDDSGEGNNSHLVYTFRTAGRYQIVVNNSGDEPRTGTYVLTVR